MSPLTLRTIQAGDWVAHEVLNFMGYAALLKLAKNAVCVMAQVG